MERPPVIYIQTKKQAEAALEEIKNAGDTPFGIDTEFDPDDSKLILMSYSYKRNFRRVVERPMVPLFKEWIENPATKLVYQNFKADNEPFLQLGINPQASFYADTMTMGWSRDEHLMSHGLKEQGEHFLRWRRKGYKELFSYIPAGKKTPIVMSPSQVLYDLPADALAVRSKETWLKVMLEYSGDDAEETIGLFNTHVEFLKSIGYWDFYLKEVVPFTNTLAACEQRGVLLNTPRLQEILRMVDINIMRAEHAFRAGVGKPRLNLRSIPQMQALIEELGWPVRADLVSPTGKPQLNKEAFDWWANEHGFELAEIKNRYQAAATLRGTFLEGLLSGVSEDGRLRSNFNQIGADCLAEGELVLTNRGYLPVEEVRVGDLVLTHTGAKKPVIDAKPNGVKTIYRVTTSNGLSLRTTGNHKYRTLDDAMWTMARDLRVGQRVVIHSDPEEWRPVEGWPDYEISSWGRLYSHKTARVRKPQKRGRSGQHHQVLLTREKAQFRGENKHHRAVHHLVAEAFVGPRTEELPIVRHVNGVSWDNTQHNVVWGTHQENAEDAKAHGVLKSKHWTSVPTVDKAGYFKSASIASIEVETPAMTYALTVADDASHVTGGIVTHNTGRISSRKSTKTITVTKTLKNGTVKETRKNVKTGANLQNIPARKEKDPYGIRAAFIAPLVGQMTARGTLATEDHVMIVADYSGFELCMAIHWVSLYEENSAMLDAMRKYKSPSAVHALTGIGMFKLPVSMDDWTQVKKLYPDQYTKSKNLNFNLLYGGQAKMLARILGWDHNDSDKLDEAQDLIDGWNKLYPEIGRYQQRMIKHGRKHGWVPTISGRHSHVGHLLESHDRGTQAQGERKCMNSPCQGSAADIVAVAMNKIEKHKKLRALGASLLFPVHDEIIMEVPKSNAEEARDIMVRLMKMPFREKMAFDVDVEAGIGPDWSSAKK